MHSEEGQKITEMQSQSSNLEMAGKMSHQRSFVAIFVAAPCRSDLIILR